MKAVTVNVYFISTNIERFKNNNNNTTSLATYRLVLTCIALPFFWKLFISKKKIPRVYFRRHDSVEDYSMFS